MKSEPTSEVLIVFGIAPGTSGTGRVARHIQEATRQASGVRLLFRPPRQPASIRRAVSQGRLWSAARISLSRLAESLNWNVIAWARCLSWRGPLVVAHPNTTGYRWFLSLVSMRRSATWLYLLDSNFFCMRSYNHLPTEGVACMRCLGGRFEESARFNCEPEPATAEDAVKFCSSLKRHVDAGRIGLLAQSKSQRDLAIRHFGVDAHIVNVGIWAADWLDAFSCQLPDVTATDGYVVFHGSPHPAKGYQWSLDLARKCPSLRFFFPFEAPPCETPPNCEFVPMSWETGLQSAVARSSVTLIPSLWSAPVEGALVKSLAMGARVAVTREPSAYSAEIPDELLVRLSANVDVAAAELVDALRAADRPRAPNNALELWRKAFIEENASFVGNIRSAVTGKAFGK